MHEIGVLCQALKVVENTAKENRIGKVDGVVFQIGELTGMLPYFFEEYYDMVAEDFPIVKGSRLKIETVPGMGRCTDCGKIYNVAACEGACPSCGSRRKEILSGQQFLIKEIIVLEQEEKDEQKREGTTGTAECQSERAVL